MPPKPPKPVRLTEAEAAAAAEAMTAAGYDYAGDVLRRLFQTCTHDEAEAVLAHVGRYAEKCGPTWPTVPWK
jgi:hypothetical protein